MKSYDSELKTFQTQFPWVQNQSVFTTFLAQHYRSMQDGKTGSGERKRFHAFKGFRQRSVQESRKKIHETEDIMHERTMKKKELSDQIWRKTSG